MAKKKAKTTAVINATEKDNIKTKVSNSEKNGEKAKIGDTKKKITAPPALLQFNGGSYTLGIPQNWMVVKEKKHQTIFYGPKVGHARMRFDVTVFRKNENTYLEVAKDRKAKYQDFQDYRVLIEKDISKNGNFKAFLLQSCWYDKKLNQVLFVRDIFLEYQDKIFVTTCIIPNTKKLKELNEIMIQVMSSFRFISRPKGIKKAKTRRLVGV